MRDPLVANKRNEEDAIVVITTILLGAIIVLGFVILAGLSGLKVVRSGHIAIVAAETVK